MIGRYEEVDDAALLSAYNDMVLALHWTIARDNCVAPPSVSNGND